MRARDFYIPLERLKLRQAIYESIQQIFEVNFNDPKLMKSVLQDENIQCGFEAETIWTNVSGEVDYDDLSWSDLEDMLGRRDTDRVDEAYREWIQENKVDDFYSDAMTEWVSDNRSYYITDFAESQDNFGEFQAEHEDDEDYSDLGTKEWAERFIEENDLEDVFEEWLRERGDEDGDIWTSAYESAMSFYNIDDFISDNYYSGISGLISDLGLTPEGSGGDGGLEEISDAIETWAKRTSEFSRVRHGSYHSTGGGTTQDYWRVEEDSSINEDNGKGAEIISPVYDSPAVMMAEMKSLFSFLNNNSVEVDDSTGLHVTMSWVGDTTETNKLKMALLLGDRYLLKQFDRMDNSYARSQLKRVETRAKQLSADITDQESLVALEQELAGAISKDKFSSINFKDLENLDNNQLIEFRIAGNEDYLTDINKVEKTVMRYAVAMQAGHDPQAYVRDYVKALLRVVGVKPKQTKHDFPDHVSDNENIKNIPLVQVIQQFAGNSDVLDYVVAAYKALNYAKSLRSEDKQAELFMEDDLTGFPVRNDETAASWQEQFKRARNLFGMTLSLIAIELITKRNQKPVTANTIMAVRRALKDFGLRYEDAWDLVKNSSTYREYSGDAFEKEEKFNAALTSLFKSQAGEVAKPAFVVRYNAIKHRVFIPKQIYDSLDIDPGRLTMRPEYFKVVDFDKLGEARYIASDITRLEKRIEQKTNELEYHIQHNQDLSDFERHKQQIIRYIEIETNELASYKGIINTFKNKYGFVPIITGSGTRSFHPEQEELNDSVMRQISHQYKVKFEEI